MKAGSRVIVIGGGITGLVAANELAKNGAMVTLLEAGSQLGGLAGSFKSSDLFVDKYYHCIMPTDSHLLDVIEKVGLSAQLKWKSAGAGLIYNSKRYPFNTALDLLLFRPLTLFQRLRLGLGSLMLPRLGGELDLDKIRAETWMCKLFGKMIWEEFWKPMLRMKFGPQTGTLPALYLRRRFGRESNKSTRGYLKCGLKGLIEALESSIIRNGGIIRPSTPVRRIKEAELGMQIILKDREILNGDWLLSTAPIPLLYPLVRGCSFEGDFEDWNIPYRGVVTTLCFLSKPLDGYYMVPALKSRISFDGLIEISALIDPIYYGDRHLVYLIKYCDSKSKLFQERKESIMERWCSELLNLYADMPLKSEDILSTYVFKAPFVEPVYQTGYLSVKPTFQVANSNLFLATSAQCYPEMTSMNSSVCIAKDSVNNLLQKILTSAKY